MTADVPSDMFAVLRDVLATLPSDADPAEDPPSSVYEGAIWVHEWVNMEAELAELAFKSEERPELSGVRASGLLRDLTFVTEKRTIEIEIEPGHRAVRLSGTVDPPVAGRVQVIVAGELSVGPLDRAGAFAIEGLPSGTALAFVETESGTIRLGSFEI